MRRSLSGLATVGLWAVLVLEAYVFGLAVAASLLGSNGPLERILVVVALLALDVAIARAAGGMILERDELPRLWQRRVIATLPRAGIALAAGVALALLANHIWP